MLTLVRSHDEICKINLLGYLGLPVKTEEENLDETVQILRF